MSEPSIIEAFEVLLPKHAASLHLTHNDHKSVYQTVEEWDNGFADWVSDGEREKAISEDSVWTLQWYPDTPVGSYAIAASSLQALIAALRSDTTEEG